MSYREVTGVSPRFATALELSDTLMCLGFDPVRSREAHCHRVTFRYGTVDVSSPYSVTVTLAGKRAERFRGAEEAKRRLMELFR